MENKIENIIDKSLHEKNIFSEYEILDWYDGPILGIGKLLHTEEFYLFQMVACDIKIEERVFLLTKAEFEWGNTLKIELNKVPVNEKPKLIKKYIAAFYENYTNIVYLLKSKDIDNKIFTLIKIDNNNLRYYDNIESVIHQDKESSKRWFNFFI